MMLMMPMIAPQGGYRGFYSRNILDLTPKSVSNIHKRGGTVLQTSRGGHNTAKIVDSIEDRGINQVESKCTDSSSMISQVLKYQK